MDIKMLLNETIRLKASDLHITTGVPPMFRVDGVLQKFNETPLNSKDIAEFVQVLLNQKQKEIIEEFGQVDFSYSLTGYGRFRINAYKQRGSYALACRLIPTIIPTFQELNLPRQLTSITDVNRGLILVTGPTGSGKSTTLAALIDSINKKRNCHIITLEDPIEYLHRHNKSIVNQREIGQDSNSYQSALRAALRQDPDVILIGEMRDLETISTAITAAETGHLVLSTLHTVGAANTIERIIDVFPPHQQQQIRMQLSTVIQAIISQQLLKKYNKPGRIPAVEIMKSTPGIRNLIREGKTHQLQSSIQMGARQGMVTMDSYLSDLYKRGLISREDAVLYSIDNDSIKAKLQMM